MTALLQAANATAYAEAKSSHDSQHAGRLQASVNVEGMARVEDPTGSEGSAAPQGSAHPGMSSQQGTPHEGMGAGMIGSSSSFSDTALARGFLNPRISAGTRGFHTAPQMTSASPAADDAAAYDDQAVDEVEDGSADAAADDANETDAVSESEADAAARAAERQKVVDDAVERLFEESLADLSPDESPRSTGEDVPSQWSGMDASQGGLSGDTHLEPESGSCTGVPSASASTSGSSSGSAPMAGSREGSDSSQAVNAEPVDGEQEPMAIEEEVRGESDNEGKEGAGALEVQGYEGVKTALQAALQTSQKNINADDKAKGLASEPVQQQRQLIELPGHVAPGVTSKVTPGVASGVAGMPGPGAGPAQRYPKGLPPLAPARGLNTAQQGPVAAHSHAASASAAAGTGLSQDQMQMLVNEMFNIGYQAMGELSRGNTDLAPASAAAASGSVAGSASAAGAGPGHADASGGNHQDMQHAFNQLVANSLQRQAHSRGPGDQTLTPQDSPPMSSAPGAAAVAAAAWTAPAAPPSGAAASAAPSPLPSSSPSTASSSAAARAQEQRHQDAISQRLLARESERVREREYRWDEQPCHYSVAVGYGADHHVNRVREQTECRRQVGFGTATTQKSAWGRPVLRGLFGVGAAVLTAGFASGRIHWRRDGIASGKDGIQSETDSAEDSETDSDDFHMH